VPEMNERELESGYFQQDGAPAHTARNTAPFLQAYFANRIISKSSKYLESSIDWPPRSPDLTPPDFFLWGHLKDHVYANNPKTLDQLKINIDYEIKNISTESLIRTSNNMIRRVGLCLDQNGGHFQHLL